MSGVNIESKESEMYTNQELCEKIQQLYPEIGRCGIDLQVTWDPAQKVWTIDFKKGERHLRHYLEQQDASACMQDEKCVGLGIDLGQFL
jgi:hypothetical protein